MILMPTGLLQAVRSESSDGGKAAGTGNEVRLDPDLGEARHPSRTDANVMAREEEAIRLDGFSPAEMREMREGGEKVEFQAEVDRMMKLIINSLYKNKEVWAPVMMHNFYISCDRLYVICKQSLEFSNL